MLADMGCALTAQRLQIASSYTFQKPRQLIAVLDRAWGVQGVTLSAHALTGFSAQSPLEVRRFSQNTGPSQQAELPNKKGRISKIRAGPSATVTVEEALALQGLSLFRKPKPKGGVASKIPPKEPDTSPQGKSQEEVVRSLPTRKKQAASAQSGGASNADVIAGISGRARLVAGSNEASGAPFGSDQETLIADQKLAEKQDMAHEGKPAKADLKVEVSKRAPNVRKRATTLREGSLGFGEGIVSVNSQRAVVSQGPKRAGPLMSANKATIPSILGLEELNMERTPKPYFEIPPTSSVAGPRKGRAKPAAKTKPNLPLEIETPSSATASGGIDRTAERTRAAEAASTPGKLTAESSIEEALAWCCASLGRAPGEAELQLSERLHANWYSKASDLTEMAELEARSLAVPVRFLVTLREGLAESAKAEGNTLNAVPDEVSDEPDRAASGQSASTSASSNGTTFASQPESESVDTVVELGGLSDPIAASAPAIDDDIMARRMPPSRRHGHGSSADVRVTKRKTEGLTSYRLKPGEGSPELLKELEAFLYHCTNRFYGQQLAPIADVTARKYVDHIRGALGWLHHEKGIPLSVLRLRSLVPTHERAGVQVGFDYVMWLLRERGITRQTEGLVARSLMRLAMFLYHTESHAQPSEGEKAYGDLMVVREYRKLANESKREAKIAPRSSDEALKWLTWPEYLAVVQELKLECAGRDHIGRVRPSSAVAWSIQRYLVFAILSCIPDRQRTLRELQLGRTLFKEGDKWVIRHGPDDYKTGRVYGVRPALAISPALYPELEAFKDTWRVHLNPQHDFLFSTKNGKPLKETDVYKLFNTTAFRIMGKKTNPHLVRDSVVTHLRGTGASERELEALAIYMGHSVEMQRSTYDRRTMAEKVGPAIELLNNLNQEAMGKRVQRSDL